MRVVICCDQSAPAEILRDTVRVGRALLERGHAVAFIVGDPVALVASAGSWVPNDLYQSPFRPAPPNFVMKPPPTDGFADLMAIAGFDDKATLIALSSIWNRQLLALKPDAIVGFSAPVLWLVGPSVAPTFALGNAWTLPVVLGTSFVRLSTDSVPLADEKLMLANANTVLLRHGAQPSLAALSEILERCNSILYGIPQFDPYAHIRKTSSIGLLGDEPTPTLPPAKQRLAIFLDVNCPNIEQIILAVASLDQIPIDICVNGATVSMRRFLEQQRQIKVWNDYATLLEEATNASALVHHGAHDVAQRCLSLGRPQLIIPWTREQEKFNSSIQWMNFTWTKSSKVSLEEMAGTLSGIAHDAAAIVAAQHHARQLANADLHDGLPRIIEQIERARPS